MALSDAQLEEVVKLNFDTQYAEAKLKAIDSTLKSIYSQAPNPANIKLLIDAERERLDVVTEIKDTQKIIGDITREAVRPEQLYKEALDGILASEKSLLDLKEKAKIANDPTIHKARLDIEKQISAEQHKQTLEKIKQGLAPENIRETVKRNREIADANKEVQKAIAKEEREQSRPGFFQKLFQSPSKAIAEVTSKGKEYVGDVKDEYKKGGIGGVLDSLVSALKQQGSLPGGGGALSKIGGAMIGGAEAGAGGALAGGAAGALGGPLAIGISAAIEVFDKLKGSINKGLASAAKSAIAPIEGLGTVLSDLQGPLGPLGAVLGVATKSLQSMSNSAKSIPVIGEGVSAVVGALAAVPATLQSILSTLTNMVSKVMPAEVRLFQYNIDRISAAIGSSFAPVLRLMTDVTRDAANMIANLIPNFQEVQEVVKPLRDSWLALRDALMGVVGAIGPTIREMITGGLIQFGEILKTLAPIFTELVGVVGTVITAMKPAIDTIMSMMAGLGSTVGQTVADTFKTLGETFQALTPIVIPIIEIFAALRSAIQPIIDVVMSVLIPVFNVLGTILHSIAPVIQAIGLGLKIILQPFVMLFQILDAMLRPALNGINQVMSIVSAGIAAFSAVFDEIFAAIRDFIGDIFKALMGSDGLKDILKMLKDAFTDAAKGLRATYNVMAITVNAIMESLGKIAEKVPVWMAALTPMGPLFLSAAERLSQVRLRLLEDKDAANRQAPHPAGQAQFQSFASYAQQAYQSAYGMTWQARNIKNQEEMIQYLRRIAENATRQYGIDPRRGDNEASRRAAREAAERQARVEEMLRNRNR